MTHIFLYLQVIYSVPVFFNTVYHNTYKSKYVFVRQNIYDCHLDIRHMNISLYIYLQDLISITLI